jgi:hypothetical protein
MADFLNEHPIFLGLLLIVLSCADLWLMIFRYEWLCSLMRKKPYLKLFISEDHSRSLTIAVALIFFTYGVLIIGIEWGIISRPLAIALTSIVVMNFFCLLARHYWRKWKFRKK